jgi:hypothetical protein
MTLVNMSLTLAIIPCAAHLADKGLPRLAATAGVLGVAAVASVPMLLAISTRSMAAAWLMQVRCCKMATCFCLKGLAAVWSGSQQGLLLQHASLYVQRAFGRQPRQSIQAGGWQRAHSASLFAVCVCVQMLDLFLNASIFGWLPTIGCRLFPVHIRATGYNFAHTAAQSWLGGLTPVIISAIALRLQQDAALPGAIYIVTGLYLTACAGISLVALAVMWRKFPQTNKDGPVVPTQ